MSGIVLTHHGVGRSRRMLVVVLLLTGVFAMSVVGSPTASATSANEEKMASYINAARADYGRAGLRLSQSLSDIAHAHSYKMAQAGSIFHTKNLSYALRNYSWTVAGENVGMGPTVYRIHRALMNSSAHKANILYRGFKRVGVGVVYKNGMYFVTEIFANYA